MAKGRVPPLLLLSPTAAVTCGAEQEVQGAVPRCCCRHSEVEPCAMPGGGGGGGAGKRGGAAYMGAGGCSGAAGAGGRAAGGAGSGRRGGGNGGELWRPGVEGGLAAGWRGSQAGGREGNGCQARGSRLGARGSRLGVGGPSAGRRRERGRCGASARRWCRAASSRLRAPGAGAGPCARKMPN